MSKSKRTIYFAICGAAGTAGRQQAHAVDQTPYAEIAALVDPNPEGLAELGRLYPRARCFATQKAMHAARRLRIDVEIIASPVHVHAAEALAAMGKRHDVMIGQPFAVSTGEAASVHGMAIRERRRVHGISPLRAMALDLLVRSTGGALGSPKTARLRRLRAGDPPASVRDDPRGAFVHLGTDLVGLSLSLFGAADGVTGSVKHRRGQRGEYVACATFDKDGYEFTVETGWTLRAGATPVDDITLDLIGSDGAMHASFPGEGEAVTRYSRHRPTIYRSSDGRLRRTTLPVRRSVAAAYKREIAEMADWCRGLGQPRYPSANLQVLRTIDDFYASVAAGHRIGEPDPVRALPAAR